MPKRKLNVLALVTDAHGGFGGISQYNRDALEAIASYDTVGRVDVLPRLADVDQLRSLPPKVNYDLSGLGGRLRFSLATARRILKRNRPDLIYCGHVNLIPSAVPLAKKNRIPIVLAIYGIDVWTPAPWAVKRMIEACGLHVISISKTTNDRFLKWCDVDPAHTSIVPNAIRLNDYLPRPPNRELAIRYGLENKTVLMTLGRMASSERYKGFDEIIDVLPRLRSVVPNLCYLAAGDGPDKQRLQDKVSSLGLTDCVIFTGRIPDETKSDYYRLADLYVMPSQGEGFGFVILEALACGVPVVASRLDGTREAVLDGKLGILVDPRDPDSIAQGIQEGLRRPREVPEGLEYFSYSHFSERLRQALSSVCPI